MSLIELIIGVENKSFINEYDRVDKWVRKKIIIIGCH